MRLLLGSHTGRDAKGRVLNDYLRRTERRATHPRLAGELLAGFATVDGRWLTVP